MDRSWMLVCVCVCVCESMWVCLSVEFLYHWLRIAVPPSSYFGAGEGIKILSGGGRRLRVYYACVFLSLCFFSKNIIMRVCFWACVFFVRILLCVRVFDVRNISVGNFWYVSTFSCRWLFRSHVKIWETVGCNKELKFPQYVRGWKWSIWGWILKF